MGKKKKQEKGKKRKEKEEKRKEKEEKLRKPDRKEKQSEPGKETRAGAPLPEKAEQKAEAQSPAEVFRALGDENRIRILELLKDGEMCAGDLLKSLSIVQSTLSHHMKILTESGIVQCRKQGKWSFYSIDKETLEKVSAYIMKWS